MTVSIGLGRVGSNFFTYSGLGWVGSHKIVRAGPRGSGRARVVEFSLKNRLCGHLRRHTERLVNVWRPRDTHGRLASSD